MAQHIEREALLDEINSAPVLMSICMNVDECKGRIYERERLVRIIDAAPAADVAPVRHGRWIEQPLDLDLCGVAYYQCSECGKEQQTPSNYCQFCGAKMDKGGE